MNRRYPDAPISAAGIVLIFEERVLLVLRRNPPTAGHWSFPGGAHEVGETIQEAARREMREETGLEIKDLRLLDVGDIILRDTEGHVEYHYMVTYFVAHPAGGTLLSSDDASDARWFSYDEALSLGLSRRLLQLTRQALTLDKQP